MDTLEETWDSSTEGGDSEKSLPISPMPVSPRREAKATKTVKRR